MPTCHDGPATTMFRPIPIRGNTSMASLSAGRLPADMTASLSAAPAGACTCWGLPFHIRKPVCLGQAPVSVKTKPFRARWLVFMHTANHPSRQPNEHGFLSPMHGDGRLNEHVANYVIGYENGTEIALPIRRRHQIGGFSRIWGENCLQAVAHRKPYPLHAHHEQPTAPSSRRWGQSQYRTDAADQGRWINWLWAWQNPHPTAPITGIRFEPVSGTVLCFAISAGNASSLPLRWEPRRKAIFRLPKQETFHPDYDNMGCLDQIGLDMGQIISVLPRPHYPNERWSRSPNAEPPKLSAHQFLVEYTAHPDACFHLYDGSRVPVAKPADGRGTRRILPVAPARRRVRIRVLDSTTRTPVPVRLHLHGKAGEYLCPLDRHRIPNPCWFEDYSTDFVRNNAHFSTYIDGETVVDLPAGPVYVEVSKGYEIRPVRKVVRVSGRTKDIVIEIQRCLPWRERGWVTADTHVHFLSPQTARLEGAGEGVNVVNLLASQWGELMTNVGDFDGQTTIGAREAGGDGEYLVRVGTENRQHVLGHISLLGYNGRMIVPMCTGGPGESALGDPIDMLLMDWARQCREQDGLVILPHFPQPRAENAAALINGLIDGIETRALDSHFGGIDPYSLSDWYRYLNCGTFVPAVGGTDKMSAGVPVGASRTYAKLPGNGEFSYDTWKQAIRTGNTFVTQGPLLEFAVEGRAPGSWIEMPATGGHVDVTWQVASVTVPMSRVDLIVNGEIRESTAVNKQQDSGSAHIHVPRSGWIALLVRGTKPDGDERIFAHSSPVMVRVANSPFFAPADALTILDQIEGAIAYLDTVGTRATTATYKQMRMQLISAHRSLHNRMHQHGAYHDHTPETDHPEHH